MSDPAGRRIRHYVIEREIARGGMSIVYKARDEHLGTLVALKRLEQPHVPDPTLVRRFETEAQLAASINHPNVVTIFDHFVYRGTPYIVMEYFPLGTVRSLVGNLTPDQTLTVLQNVLTGVAAAHEHGVLHRDLKPENLMRTDYGSVKVADFGIARAYVREDGDNRLTPMDRAIGTPLYIAPEVGMGQDASTSADVYGVGAIAFELLVGSPAFADTPGNEVAIVMRKYNEDAPRVEEKCPDLHLRFARWVDRLLARQPAQRPTSAQEAASELSEIVERVPMTPASLPVSILPRPPQQETPPTPRQGSRFASWSAVTATAPPRRLAWHAITRPLFLFVAAALASAAVALDQRIAWVAAVALPIMLALTFFDLSEAERLRRSKSAPRRDSSS